MQSEYVVKINTIERVKNFADVCNKYKCDIDLMQGRYVIDAKSIMGIFSLDLTNNPIVKIHTEDIVTLVMFREEMSDFIVYD